MKFPHYWICGACVNEHGGTLPDGQSVTMAAKRCEYCEGKKQVEKFIAPWVDYDWPDADDTMKARMGRD